MTDEAVTREIRELMEARSAFYRMLAALYFQPLSQQQLEAMDLDGAAGALEGVPGVGEGLGLMAAGLGRRHTGTRRELAVDFTTSFGGVGVLDEQTALPCKSVFVGEDGLLFGDECFKVFEAYKASRVRKADGADMPDDHLSFMLEFMALLSDRASAALAAGDGPSARAEAGGVPRVLGRAHRLVVPASGRTGRSHGPDRLLPRRAAGHAGLS